MVLEVVSAISDLKYGRNPLHLPSFIFCLTNHFVYLFLYVYVGSSFLSLRLLEIFYPNEGIVKLFFILNPVVLSFLLLYLG